MAVWRDDFSLSLNGQPVTVTGTAPRSRCSILFVPRASPAPKKGAPKGECGACAVLVSAWSGGVAAWRSVNSCLVPLPAMAGREVVTVEGLADGDKLSEVQAAMVRFGGSQCGYCTPGFIVGMTAAQLSGDTDLHALGGNLCRCTGYRPIADAFRSLVDRPRLASPTATPVERLQYQSAEGRFSRPETLAECFELMQSDPAACLVAGNTDLGIDTNLRDRRFPHLISLDAIDDLHRFEDGPDFVEIGAALSLTEIGERWHGAPAVVRQWLDLFASPLIRNRATLGGNLATASPIGDSAPLLLSLDASVVIASQTGNRTVPLEDFFLSYRKTALGPGDVLRSIRIPKPFPADARFYKVAKRRLDDISTVAAGIAITRDTEGVIAKARIGYGGVAATPVRARDVEAAITGTCAGEGGKEVLGQTIQPIGDHRGSALYRLAMAQNLLEKALAL